MLNVLNNNWTLQQLEVDQKCQAHAIRILEVKTTNGKEKLGLSTSEQQLRLALSAASAVSCSPVLNAKDALYKKGKRLSKCTE